MDSSEANLLRMLRYGTDQEKRTARLNLAVVFEARGMLEEAVEVLEGNVWAGFRDASTYRRLASLYRRLGRQDLADQATIELMTLTEVESQRLNSPARDSSLSNDVTTETSALRPTHGMANSASNTRAYADRGIVDLSAASLRRRSLAFLIDICVMLFLTTLIYVLIDQYFRLGFTGIDSHRRIGDSDFIASRFWFQITCWAFIVIIYEVLPTATPLKGTIGKVVLRIGVYDTDYYPIGLGRAFGRSIVKWLSFNACCLLAIFSWWSARQSIESQAWHDRATGTMVYRR